MISRHIPMLGTYEVMLGHVILPISIRLLVYFPQGLDLLPWEDSNGMNNEEN